MGKRSFGRRFGVAIAAAGLAVAAAVPTIGGAADHLDAPGLTPPGGDTRADITDVYAFNSSGNVTIVAGFNPAAGVIGETTFGTDISYEINVDTDAALGSESSKRDAVYRISFEAPDSNGNQAYTVRKTPASKGGAVIAQGVTGQTTDLRDGGRVTAGLFDDPFFFDLNGFNDELAFTGDDFFKGFNVTAIVLEVPASEITGNDTSGGVWVTTNKGGEQIDRMGRPAINTVFIPSSQKNAFNEAKPKQDARRYTDEVLATLAALQGDSPLTDAALANVLLPDILTIDTSMATEYPNGRALVDDVIDTSLFLITGIEEIGDFVPANDVPFRTMFPYLAPAN